MGYRFKRNQSVTDNVRRIAMEEFRSAISRLQGRDPEQWEEDIHEARKSIKRLRALLRLARPQLGRWYGGENKALRDIGRSLSQLRDSSIVLETFDAVASMSAERKNLQPVRSALQQQKKAQATLLDREETLRQAAEELRQASGRVSHWTLQSEGFEALAEGLKTEYRAGRREMPKALKRNDSVAFHEWRKRAKCLLYHLRLLKNFLAEDLRKQEQLLHELETALGEDHNLLILRQCLDSYLKMPGGKRLVKQTLSLMSKRESELRAEAQALGAQIYGRKPKEFVQELRPEWEKAPADRFRATPRKKLRITPRKVRTTAA